MTEDEEEGYLTVHARLVQAAAQVDLAAARTSMP